MSKTEDLAAKIIELRQGAHEAAQATVKQTLTEYAAANGVDAGRRQLKLKRTLKGHAAKIHDLDFSRNQPDMLISASQDGKLIVWNGPTTHKVYVVPLESQWVLTAGISHDANFCASGGLDNTVSIFRLQEDQAIPEISAELKGHDGSISKIRFLTDTHVLSCSGDATIKQWDVTTENCVNTYNGHLRDVTCVSVAGDSNTFVTGSIDQSSYLWDSRTGEPVMSFTGHRSDVNSVAFFPNDQAFASCSDDGTIRLFDLRGDRTLQLYEQPEDEKEWFRILSVAFSGSGRYLYSTNHTSCYVWNTLTGAIDQSLSHSNFVSVVAVPSDGSCVATGCWDNNLEIFL